MNQDQINNIQDAFDKVFDALFRCWSYVHLIRGFQAAAKENEKRLEEHALAIDLIYRGIFDALFATFGTLVDKTKGTFSLPSIINMIRRYTIEDDKDRSVLSAVEKALQPCENSPMTRMNNWRHKVVAHHTREGRSSGFYPTNKLYLDEVEELLQKIENLANQISVQVLRKVTECRSGAEKDIRRQAYSLIKPQ